METASRYRPSLFITAVWVIAMPLEAYGANARVPLCEPLILNSTAFEYQKLFTRASVARAVDGSFVAAWSANPSGGNDESVP